MATDDPSKIKTDRTERSTGTVTVKDVAALAGVSAITVSRVINHPDLVTPATRDAVQAAVEQLGYVPNLLAGGLRSKFSRLVAAIVPSIRTAMFAEAIDSLTETLNRSGYEVLLGLSGFEPAKEEKILAAVLSRKPDALFLTGMDHTARARRQLLSAGIPVLESWDLGPPPIDMAVGFSHDKAGRAAGRHFIAQGYETIAAIAAQDNRAQQRLAGFLEELAAHGRSACAVKITEAPGTLHLGRTAFAEMWDEGLRPQAVFCTADPLAQGVITEAMVRGVRVPKDVAVMGFGNFAFAPFIQPSLTTIDIDSRQIGESSAQMILAALAGEAQPRRVIDVGFRLIERGSTAAGD